eukprot:5230257-Ditylum_brightwellii.AAC.1
MIQFWSKQNQEQEEDAPPPPTAPRVWISFDNINSTSNNIGYGPAAVNDQGYFTSPYAKCPA